MFLSFLVPKTFGRNENYLNTESFINYPYPESTCEDKEINRRFPNFLQSACLWNTIQTFRSHEGNFKKRFFNFVFYNFGKIFNF